MTATAPALPFEAWPKIPRLNRPVVVTEKVDGSNGAVVVAEGPAPTGSPSVSVAMPGPDGFMGPFHVYAQSRKRVLEPTKQGDNFGFAAWVLDHAETLARHLGPGRHFGEWYGSGIQRGYGMENGERRFALFNTHRWSISAGGNPSAAVLDPDLLAAGVTVVPILGYLDSLADRDGLRSILRALERHGSRLVPEFSPPEGVVLFHAASRQTFKVLLEGDDVPKGVAS